MQYSSVFIFKNKSLTPDYKSLQKCETMKENKTRNKVCNAHNLSYRLELCLQVTMSLLSKEMFRYDTTVFPNFTLLRNNEKKVWTEKENIKTGVSLHPKSVHSLFKIPVLEHLSWK